LRLLLWPPTISTTETLEPFVQSLVDLLDADLILMDIPQRSIKSFEDLRCAVIKSNPDLIVFQAHNISQLKRILSYSTTQTQIDRLPALLFVPQIPRWPLANILLTLPDGDTKDESAINWAVKFASSGQSAVTVLPLLPPVPGCYGSFIQHSLTGLLKAEDPMGRKMHSITGKFSEEGIKGIFKLRAGEPVNQLRDELLSLDPDLVIIPSSAHSCFRRWITGDMVNPLLKWSNQPVLISPNIRRELK